MKADLTEETIQAAGIYSDGNHNRKLELAFRLALLTLLIPAHFDRSLSLTLDRLIAALEEAL